MLCGSKSGVEKQRQREGGTGFHANEQESDVLLMGLGKSEVGTRKNGCLTLAIFRLR